MHKQETGLGRWGVFQWLGGHRPGCGGVHTRCPRLPLHPPVAGGYTCTPASRWVGRTRAIHTELFRGAGARRGTSERSVWGFLISGGGNEDAHEARLAVCSRSHHPSLAFSQLIQSRALGAVVTERYVSAALLWGWGISEPCILAPGLMFCLTEAPPPHRTHVSLAPLQLLPMQCHTSRVTVRGPPSQRSARRGVCAVLPEENPGNAGPDSKSAGEALGLQKA